VKKPPKPKKINFELIPPDGKHESYRFMEDIRSRYHEHLLAARIGIAWRKSLKADVDGKLILGKCVKASDPQREVAAFDFIILLNREVWNDLDFTEKHKRALVDHELCHAEIALGKDGEPKYDERGRNIWRMRKHDIEEFRAVVQRHGLYKRDLEEFGKVLLQKQNMPLLAAMEKPAASDHAFAAPPVVDAAKPVVIKIGKRKRAPEKSDPQTQNAGYPV
jgi:hypothetical protein